MPHGTESLAAFCDAVVSDLPVHGMAVGVMRSDPVRETVYASDRVIAEIERRQFSLGEGPVLDAFKTGRPVLVPELGAPDPARRWPVFTGEVAALAVGGLFAFPMRLGAITIGVCELYRAEPGALTPQHLAIVLRAVDVLALTVLALRSDGSAEAVDASWLDGHDGARRAVYQATGMLIVQLGVPPEQAFARLRGHAYAEGRSVEQVAADIVARRIRLEPDPEPDPQPP
jgi:hypothetical protein